ncbi:MAG: hypothetical protein MJ101_06260 [Clostridia bacterium]|nr:hypothetical protein [Clostridia bacterium]
MEDNEKKAPATTEVKSKVARATGKTAREPKKAELEPGKSQRAPRKRAEPKPPKVDLMITVVNREKAEFYSDYLQEYEVNMQFIVQAHGTASEEILNYLGMTATDKAVIFGIIRQDKVKEAFSGLSDKFTTIKRGAGISFTVPLTSAIGVAIYRFMINQTQGGRL